MQLSQEGLCLIKAHEGLSLTPYTCPAGKLTIGYGHVVKQGEVIAENFNEFEAQRLLKADISTVERAIGRLVAVPLTQKQYDALVSLIFNIGVAAFANSTLRACLNRGNYTAAAREFLRWKFASGRVIEGLARRRAAEMAIFKKNDKPS